MSDLYRKRTDSQSAFTKQLFPLFCEGVGYGDANDFAQILYGKHTVEDFMYADDFVYWTVYGYFKDVVIPHKIAVFKAGMEFTKKVWFPKFISENAELWTDNLYLHRQIMGVSDRKMVVDHINGNQLDNRRDNLRVCSHSQNSMNCKPTKGRRIPFKGVFARPSGRFGAQIMFDRRNITIGTFDTPEQAARAYDEKAKELFGEFANLNFKD